MNRIQILPGSCLLLFQSHRWWWRKFLYNQKELWDLRLAVGKPLQCYLRRHRLWFRKCVSPKLLKAGSIVSYWFVYSVSVLCCYFASETVHWARWNVGSTLTCLFLFHGLLFADCKQEERANKRFAAPGMSAGFSPLLGRALVSCLPGC